MNIDRFFNNIDKTDNCWIWNGVITKKGYGRYGNTLAHRLSYTLAKGEIKDNLVIDHLCRNRACVNPDHLEVVTNAENIKRGSRATSNTCKNGHEWSGKNDIQRICHICRAEASKRFRERNEEKARAFVSRWYAENKEEYNAKRREKYLQNKLDNS